MIFTAIVWAFVIVCVFDLKEKHGFGIFCAILIFLSVKRHDVLGHVQDMFEKK